MTRLRYVERVCFGDGVLLEPLPGTWMGGLLLSVSIAIGAGLLWLRQLRRSDGTA